MDYKLLYEQQLAENSKLKEANDTFTLGAKRTIESNCKLYKANKELKKRIEGTIYFIELCDKYKSGMYINFETRCIASRLIDGNITDEETDYDPPTDEENDD